MGGAGSLDLLRFRHGSVEHGRAHHTPPTFSRASKAVGCQSPALYCGVSTMALRVAKPAAPAPITQMVVLRSVGTSFIGWGTRRPGRVPERNTQMGNNRRKFLIWVSPKVFDIVQQFYVQTMHPFEIHQRNGSLPPLMHSMHTIPTVTRSSTCSHSRDSPARNVAEERLIEKLTTVLGPILKTHQQNILDHMVGLEASVGTLAQDIAFFKEQTKQSQKDVTEELIVRLDRLEKLIGGNSVSQECMSLMDRLDLVEFTAGEFLKRGGTQSTPGAFRCPIEIMADLNSSLGPLRCEMGINTTYPSELLEKGTWSRTKSFCPSSTNPDYVDAAVNASNTPVSASQVASGSSIRRILCLRDAANERGWSISRDPNVQFISSSLVAQSLSFVVQPSDGLSLVDWSNQSAYSIWSSQLFVLIL